MGNVNSRPEPELRVQAARLSPLRRMLELDGFTCRDSTNIAGVPVPLMVERGGRSLAVGVQSGLLVENWQDHSLKRLINSGRARGTVLNDYILRRNLPDEHQLIRDTIGG